MNHDLIRRLRISVRRGLGDAARREAKKATKGHAPARVTVTVDQLMQKLARNDYRCAISGLPFWDDSADRFGPSLPSIDRIRPDGDYSDANTRVILLGVNGLRGRGSDRDMMRIARAIVGNFNPQKQAWATRRAIN